MNVPDTPNCFETLKDSISRVVLSCFGWLTCFQRHHLVHPVNTHLESDTFLELSAHRRIHAIHIAPRKLPKGLSNKPIGLFTLDQNVLYNSVRKQNSESVVPCTDENSYEDYWFTRWSRPLRVPDNCNCSFRRHWRKSLRESKRKLNIVAQAANKIYYDTTKDNIDLNILCSSGGRSITENTKRDPSLIEICAETLIEDILVEAISRLSLKNSNVHVLDTKDCGTDGIVKPNCSGVPSNCTSVEEKADSMSPSCSNTVIKNIHNPNEINIKMLSHGTDKKSSNIYADRNVGDSSRSTGCINPSFLISASDPVIVDNKEPPAKTCTHVKRPTKPLLYFLHGAGSSSDIWWGLLHYFVAAGFEVLAPDMLGHGFSSSPDHASSYTFQRLLKDAVDVFDRFVGEHGKCVVIGHAYGCSFAAAVARHRPQVTHLVLISGGGPTPLAPAHVPSTFPCLRACLKPFLVCGFKRDVMYAPCGKHMVACEALSDGVSRYVLRHVARGQDWPEGDSTFHRRILVPTLLVHGLRDPHVTLVQECEMERTIPRSFLEVIPNAGHLSMLETPGQLSHMVHCFIEWWSR